MEKIGDNTHLIDLDKGVQHLSQMFPHIDCKLIKEVTIEQKGKYEDIVCILLELHTSPHHRPNNQQDLLVFSDEESSQQHSQDTDNYHFNLTQNIFSLSQDQKNNETQQKNQQIIQKQRIIKNDLILAKQLQEEEDHKLAKLLDQNQNQVAIQNRTIKSKDDQNLNLYEQKSNQSKIKKQGFFQKLKQIFKTKEQKQREELNSHDRVPFMELEDLPNYQNYYKNDLEKDFDQMQERKKSQNRNLQNNQFY